MPTEQSIPDAPARPCEWPGSNPTYVAYHDEEWGVPEYDDRALFEKLVLDGFQAGLSWWVILKKRDSFRAAFDGFDPDRIAAYGPEEVDALLQDAGIVRSRAKIEATIGNAAAWRRLMDREEGGFSQWLWAFVGGEPVVNHWAVDRDVPTQTDASVAMSKALKKEGFRFCGPVLCYAFMQAVGMVNDHTVACARHAACQAFTR